jgi:hypothetical protein
MPAATLDVSSAGGRVNMRTEKYRAPQRLASVGRNGAQSCTIQFVVNPSRRRLGARRVGFGIPDGRREQVTEHVSEIAAAMKVLDDFMVAFNTRDVEAFEATFNFPSVRLASNTLRIIEKGDHKPEMFGTGALAEWDRSAWERRDVIHSGADKVHIDTRFTRYRADGSVIGGFDSVYVVTCQDGHWGVKIRSSYAP